MTGKTKLPAAIAEAHLGELRQRLERGEGAALFSAIRFCGDQKLVMPEWLVVAFFHATNRWYALESKTLDEAFQVSWPKGAQLEAARRKRDLGPAVHRDVLDSRTNGHPINAALFVAVGRRHGISKTTAEKYYRSMLARYAAIESRGLNKLLDPFMTPDAKVANATRKVAKLRGSRSKSR